MAIRWGTSVTWNGGDRYDPERMRTMLLPVPGRFTNTVVASGALQLFASSTAAFDVAGSRVGMAAGISLGASATSVGSASPAGPDGFPPTRPGTTAAVAIPAVTRAPMRVIRMPRDGP